MSEFLLLGGEKSEFCCTPSFVFQTHLEHYCHAACNCFKRVCFASVLQRVQAAVELMDLLKVKY